MAKIDERLARLEEQNIDLARRLGRIEVLLDGHTKEDQQHFEDVRRDHEEELKEFGEVRLLISDKTVSQDDFAKIQAAITKLQLTQAGQKPWLDLLIKAIYLAFGALVGYGLMLLGVGK